MTVIKEPDGRYYVSFVVEVAETPLPEVARATGVDLGLESLTAEVSSDGTRHKEPNPRHLKRKERALARAQRALSRKQKGSANRAKARVKVGALHRKVRQTRLDHHHKLARRLVHENQVVAVEGLAIHAMARTKMAKSIHDAAWAILLRLLKEKAAQYGRSVIRIDQWEPTTQTCCVCRVKDDKKPLSVRVWTCRSCGVTLDRDFNAAVNILLAAGLAESLNACGPDVRRLLASAVGVEAGTRRMDLADHQAA